MSHITEKPVELAARAIQYSSLPKENVLDPIDPRTTSVWS
jgi:DNA modification methylase